MKSQTSNGAASSPTSLQTTSIQTVMQEWGYFLAIDVPHDRLANFTDGLTIIGFHFQES